MQCFSGGGERVRTDDLLRARQALSQLSYTPEKAALKMVGLDGFEPSTSRLSGVRSNQAELQALCPCQGSRQHRKMTEPLSFIFHVREHHLISQN